MKDRESKYMFVNVLPKKGKDEYAIKRILQDFEFLGHLSSREIKNRR